MNCSLFFDIATNPHAMEQDSDLKNVMGSSQSWVWNQLRGKKFLAVLLSWKHEAPPNKISQLVNSGGKFVGDKRSLVAATTL